MKRLYVFLSLALFLTLFAACSPQPGDNGGESAPDIPTLDPDRTGDGGTDDASITRVPTAGGWLDGSPADVGPGAVFESSSEEGEAVAADSMSAGADEDGVALAEPPPVERPEVDSESTDDRAANQNSQLNAGEVDDNANWDDYLLFLREYAGASVIEMDVSERHQIQVVDQDGRPVLGAVIDIEAHGQRVARLRSHSDGLAYFFPRTLPESDQAQSYSVRVQSGDQTQEMTLESAGAQREWQVVMPLDQAREAGVNLDILFLIDTTGSMGDEIAQLKENIQAISAQIDAMPGQPNVRFGMTVYRDQGDSYLSRTFDFTPDVEEFAAGLADVEAGGGGDYPEDLNEGLSRAIHAPEWRVEETISLIFLVADAPPHLDYFQENHYGVEIVVANERGIKIFPIASSGLDGQGEYIFRQLAQFTGGKFIFLTYGESGPGSTGTETTHNVDDYTVSALDDLVVKIVEEELTNQEFQ